METTTQEEVKSMTETVKPVRIAKAQRTFIDMHLWKDDEFLANATGVPVEKVARRRAEVEAATAAYTATFERQAELMQKAQTAVFEAAMSQQVSRSELRTKVEEFVSQWGPVSTGGENLAECIEQARSSLETAWATPLNLEGAK